MFKIFYLIAVVLFVLAVFVTTGNHHFVEWGLAAVAAGLLTDGYGPALPTR